MNKIEKITDELEDLHEVALKCFAEADAAWRDIRLQSQDDVAFYHGKQWDDNMTSIARSKREPQLSVNRLPQFVKQIENSLRSQDIAITCAATSEEGSEDTANIFTGIIRGIEQRSNAKTHYIYAAGENGALVPGIGYLKVEVDYADREGFLQDIRITSIKDPMKILVDPSAQEMDFSDASYWLEFEDYTEPAFKKAFPRAQCSSVDAFPSGSSLNADGIRVARFWYKEETSVTKFLMDDGTIEVEERIERLADDDNYTVSVDGTTKTILRERTVTSHKIKYLDFTGAEVLNQGEWAGSKFPFVAVTGPAALIDGKRDIRGIIRFAKDSQKMLNFMASSAARRIASANKSPWIVDRKSIAPYLSAWNKANTENMPYLPYDSYDDKGNGRQLPPPQRADQTGQIQDLLQAAAKFEDDLKATIGIYDAGLGATANEQSGVAIQTLAQQGQNANAHFSDYLSSAIKTLGEILLDLIPRIYDTPRVVQVVGANSKMKMVKINELFSKNGSKTIYDIANSAGIYGVVINVGPAYATIKQAAIEQMTQLMRVNPAIAPFVQDIIAGNMDFEGKDIVRDRLLKVLAMTNPGVIEDAEQADVPPQALAKIAASQAMIEQMNQAIQELQVQNAQMSNALQNKSIEHNNSMEAQQYRAQLEAELQAQKLNGEIALSQARAAENAKIAAYNQEMQQIKVQLAHTEQMMRLTLEAMKQFGPAGGEMVQQILPKVDAAVDIATNN